MKESTKNLKAVRSFKQMAETCVNSFVSLADHTVNVCENFYKCHVQIENMTCTVFEITDNLSHPVETFKII